jgi:xylulokinase
VVVSGGLDQACAALAAGVIDPGVGLLSLGTTGVIGAAMSALTPAMLRAGMLAMPHVAGGRLITLGGVAAGGSLLRWYRDELGFGERDEAARTGRDVYDVITSQVHDRPTGVLVLPHFSGSRFAFSDPDARGLVLGLTFGTTRADLVRGFMEGVAYELAVIRDRFEAVGLPIKSLRAAGGGSRSDSWMQIVADALGLAVHALARFDASAAGAALLAMAGIGAVSSSAELPATMRATRRTFEARQSWAAYHAQRLENYRKVYSALRDVYRGL